MSDTRASKVGAAIELARTRAGLKAVDVAARTKALGTPIHRVALSKMEAGDRVITVDELLVLAAALNVSPTELLFPELPDGSVKVFPAKEEVSASAALAWFAGKEGLDGGLHPSPRMNLVYVYLEHVRRIEDLTFRLMVEAPSAGMSDEEREILERQLKYARHFRAQVAEQLKQADFTVEAAGLDG